VGKLEQADEAERTGELAAVTEGKTRLRQALWLVFVITPWLAVVGGVIAWAIGKR
jgi:hypothetical protein